jgi:hypothetical protein
MSIYRVSTAFCDYEYEIAISMQNDEKELEDNGSVPSSQRHPNP